MTNYYGKTLPKIEAITNFVEEQKIVSARQVFYHLVAKGLVQNTESSYVGLSQLINKLRFDRLIPFDSISDSTSLYGQTQYGSFESMIEQSKGVYRSNWDYEFETYVEVWLEKEALANVIYPVSNRYGVMLSVSGGRTTQSQVHSCIKRLSRFDKPAVILYMGDFDPTGLNISNNLPEQFVQQSSFINYSPPDVKRIALNENQLDIIPRSYQRAKPKDPNYKWFVSRYGEQVWELDAFTSEQIQDIVTKELVIHRSPDKIRELMARDKAELEGYD